MIGALVELLRPFIEPVFALDFRAPALPEGDSQARAEQPCESYLAYRYAGALLSATLPLLYLGGVSTALIVALGRGGVAIACVLGLLALGGVTLLLVGARLDYELTDYLIGTRSLRVRSGAFVTREITLSYANIQKIEVSQGPLERAFGFSRLIVSTAGGSAEKEGGGHRAVIAGIEDADALRDELLAIVRRVGGAGLGDAHEPTPGALPIGPLREVLAAARALREAAEARAHEPEAPAKAP